MNPSRLARLCTLLPFASLAASCDFWSSEPTKPNPAYCDDATPCTDPARPVCDRAAHACGPAPDGAATCSGPTDCTPDRPVCDASGAGCRACRDATDDGACAARDKAHRRCGAGGTCVACRAGTQATDCTTEQAPICDASGSCRACRAHAECLSGACLPDGRCAPMGTVAFVDNGGKAPADCRSAGVHDGSRTSPYCDVQDAVGEAAMRPTIKVAGSAAGYGPVSIGARQLVVLGPGRGATPSALIQGDRKTDALKLTADGATVNILDGFEFTGASLGAHGVECNPSPGSATLTIRDSSIHDNNGAGVSASSCTVTLDANLIFSNQGGGIKIAGGTFTITNNIVAINGTTGRGVSLDDQSTGTFAFNTVVKNKVGAGVGGIDCGAGVPKAITFSIVWGNDVEGGSQIGAKCTLTSVVTGTDVAPQAIQKDPTFVDPMKGDYHLKADDPANAACCVDQATPPEALSNRDHDVDLSQRPRGRSWDLGAHEVQ